MFVVDNCELRVEGSMARSSKSGWLARLSFADRNGRTLGTRQLEGMTTTCASLRGPTSLVIALMLETAESTVSITESTPALPVVTAPMRAQVNATEGRANADVRAAYGLLPGMSVGASLGVDATLSGVLPGRFEAAIWLPRSTGPGPGGRFWAWHTGLALCPNLNTSDRLRLALCGGAQLGLVHATGANLSEAESLHRPYGHVETRMVLSIPLARTIALSAHVALAVPFLRPRFVYWDDRNFSHEVHQPNKVLLLGGLGLIWMGAKP